MSKDDVINRSGRRKILKQLGVGAVGLSSLSRVATARPDKRMKGPEAKQSKGPATGSFDIDPTSKGMTDEERANFIKDMASKFGESAASTIIPSPLESPNDDLGTLGQQPGLEPGNIVWDKQKPLTVKNVYGQTLVESANYAALYNTDVYKAGGQQRYYFYWLWSSAIAKDHWNITGNIKEFWNHIDLTNSAELTVYDPGGDIEKNGFPVTVSASVSGETAGGGGSASAGISGTFWLSQDTVGPHPNKTSQSSDEFAVRWKGNYEGSQEINGTLIERRDTWDNRSFTWNIFLDGDGF